MLVVATHAKMGPTAPTISTHTSAHVPLDTLEWTVKMVSQFYHFCYTYQSIYILQLNNMMDSNDTY